MLLQDYYYTDSRVKKEVQTLIKNNFQVNIYCLKEKNEKYGSSNSLNVITIDTVKRIKRASPIAMIRYWIKIIFTLLKEEKIQILHCHDFPTLVPGFFLKKIKKIPYLIYDSHELFPDAVYAQYGRFLGSTCQFIENRLINTANITIGVSHQRNNLMIRRVPSLKNKIVYLPNFPSQNIMKNVPRVMKNDNTHYTIVYLGIIKEDRHYDSFINSIKILKMRKSPIKALIIGSGPYEKKITEKIKKEKLSNTIKMVSFLPYEKALSLLSTTDIGICFFANKRNLMFAMPNKFFEYLQMEIPVITSFNYGINDFSKKIGTLIVDPKDPISIADSIEQLINNPDLRKNIVNKGNYFLKREWNWEKVELNLINAYVKFLKTTASRF